MAVVLLPAGNEVLGFRLVAIAAVSQAQQPATSGRFVLHKSGQAIGAETYAIKSQGAIESQDETYTLTSRFLFTDPRATPVLMETRCRGFLLGPGWHRTETHGTNPRLSGRPGRGP